MFHQTATILRAAELTGANGAKAVQRDWENATAIAVPFAVNVQPDATADEDATGVGTTSRWKLFTPPGTALLALRTTDRVTVAGLIDDAGELLQLEVDGRPAHWPSPDGGWHHTEATLVLQPLQQVGSAGGALSAARDALSSSTSTTWSPS